MNSLSPRDSPKTALFFLFPFSKATDFLHFITHGTRHIPLHAHMQDNFKQIEISQPILDVTPRGIWCIACPLARLFRFKGHQKYN